MKIAVKNINGTWSFANVDDKFLTPVKQDSNNIEVIENIEPTEEQKEILKWDGNYFEVVNGEVVVTETSDGKTKKKEYEDNLYIELRKSEYPSIEECIHALLDGGQTLIDLQEKRNIVKTKYPKP